jgi:hypothetical protein
MKDASFLGIRLNNHLKQVSLDYPINFQSNTALLLDRRNFFKTNYRQGNYYFRMRTVVLFLSAIGFKCYSSVSSVGISGIGALVACSINQGVLSAFNVNLTVVGGLLLLIPNPSTSSILQLDLAVGLTATAWLGGDVLATSWLSVELVVV